MKSKTLLIVTVLAGSLSAGCASYYKVTNPQTQEVYYTDNIQRQQSGVIVFKDSKSKQEITLPASEIQQITKDQYEAGQQAPAQMPTTRPS